MSATAASSSPVATAAPATPETGPVEQVRYRPLVAAVPLGLLAAAVAAQGADEPHRLGWAAAALLLPLLVGADLQTLRLPTPLVTAAGTLTVAGALAGGVTASALLVAAACALGGYAALWVVWLLAPAGGLGYGDVRLAGVIGFALGLHSPLLALIGVVVLAPLLALVGLPLLALASRSGAVPYGPALAGAALLAMAVPDLVTRTATGL